MEKRRLTSPRVKRPVGWSSQAWSVVTPAKFVFTSGLTSRDHVTGEVVHVGDIHGQTRQVHENLKLVLAEDGAALADIVKVTVYLRALADFDAFQEVRREYFPKDPPASTTVVISSLADERLLIEIEAIAVVAPRARRRGPR
jgi:2-iminobutanoate/2-iminopropanoate deaminase